MDCDANGGAAYSPYHIIPHIKTISLTNYTPTIIMEPNDSGNNLGVFASIGFPYNQWSGVEFRIRNVVKNGRKYTYMDVWQYDERGNGTQVISDYEYEYSSLPETYKWNSFFFGGNNSNTYSWGDSMSGPYYVDDFVIDDQRIGPTYFARLNSQPIPESCSDNLQNQNETATDCGGVCPACPDTTAPGVPVGVSVE